jgi:TPR repeat protein
VLARGSYEYIGTTLRNNVIAFWTSDEVAANLPVGGLSWLSDLSGRYGIDNSLLAHLVMVGKRSSAKKQAERGELKGGCDGATHFVRAATVGAFVVQSGSEVDLQASAKSLGKGASAASQSGMKIQAQDGDREACRKAKPDDKAPPDQCGAIVRIELEPIGGKPAEAPELAVATCAPGFAMADGACVLAVRPHQCRPGDAAECTRQCDADDGGSCATLAAMHRDGLGIAKDWAKAAALADRACQKNVAAGCRTLAAAKLTGEGTAKDVQGGLALLDKACAAGDGLGCIDLGIARLAAKKLANDAQYAFRRACYGGGEFDGCAWLGALYAEGKGGLAVNAKLAAGFFEKGCKEGSARACDGLGELVKSGKGVDKDPARAKALFEQACNGGFAPACKK